MCLKKINGMKTVLFEKEKNEKSIKTEYYYNTANLCIKCFCFRVVFILHFEPKYRRNIPTNTPIRSMTFSFMYLSRITIAPYKKGTITPERRMVETTDIIESGNVSA